MGPGATTRRQYTSVKGTSSNDKAVPVSQQRCNLQNQSRMGAANALAIASFKSMEYLLDNANLLLYTHARVQFGMVCPSSLAPCHKGSRATAMASSFCFHKLPVPLEQMHTFGDLSLASRKKRHKLYLKNPDQIEVPRRIRPMAAHQQAHSSSKFSLLLASMCESIQAQTPLKTCGSFVRGLLQRSSFGPTAKRNPVGSASARVNRPAE